MLPLEDCPPETVLVIVYSVVLAEVDLEKLSDFVLSFWGGFAK